MASDSPPVGVRAGLFRAVAAITALTLATAGCSYRSTYVAPTDGRARVIWGPGDAPATELSGANLSTECETELRQATERSRIPLARGHVELAPTPGAYPSLAYAGPTSGSGGGEYWVPRFYGPRIVVLHPGLVPPFPHVPLFVPRLVAPVPLVGRGGGSIGGRGGGSLNLGGGKDLGVLVLVLAVITASVLPAVALGLAASMPESSGRSASAIDFANAYNDLARLDGTPCTPVVLQEQPQ